MPRRRGPPRGALPPALPLSPIREESMVRSPQPKPLFPPIKWQRVAINHKPVLVQALPPLPPVPRRADDGRKPVEVNHTSVDQLVADYLHYARYSRTLPVYQTESDFLRTCPCCFDRNRENVRRKHGPNREDVERLEQSGRGSGGNETPRPQDALDPSLSPSPRGSPPAPSPRRRRDPEELYPGLYTDHGWYDPSKRPSTRERRLDDRHVLPQPRRPWMTYQPLPYATNYLNPEFNRPSVIRSYLEDRPDPRITDSSERLLDATVSYEEAMHKLGKLSRQDSELYGY